jgi:serine phosphatase RsbU (regulator of sigma subunit)
LRRRRHPSFRIVIAPEGGAGLYEGQSRASDVVLGLLQQTSTILAGGSSLDRVLDECMHAVVYWTDAAFARVWLFDHDDQTLVLRASAGQYTHLDGPHGRILLGEFKIGAIAALREPHVTNDVQHDPQVSDHQWAVREGMVGFAGHPLVVDGRLVGVTALFARHELGQDTLSALSALASSLATGIQRLRAEEALRSEAEIVDGLYRIGTLIAGQTELASIVQTATDEATHLSGARYGAFFYNTVGEEGDSYELYALAGASRSSFEHFPLPRATALFAPTFRGVGVVRSADITADHRYGRNSPNHGIPEGHLPVRSYLAVPVISRHGHVIGGLFLGHERTGRFDTRAERIAVGIAQHAALAVDAAQQLEAEHRIAVGLQRSLLPHDVPACDGLDIAVRYVAASDGLEIGGDWYDVTLVPGGTVALGVGDAMGHDLAAASAMTRVRNIVRVYAIDGYDPATVLSRTDRILTHVGYLHMTTALHASFEPSTGKLVLASAGHPPAFVVTPDGKVRPAAPDLDVGPPLGIAFECDRTVASTVLDPGATLVMYTDGLIERHTVPLPDALAQLADILAGTNNLTANELCGHLIDTIGVGAEDDIALVVVKREK